MLRAVARVLLELRIVLGVVQLRTRAGGTALGRTAPAAGTPGADIARAAGTGGAAGTALLRVLLLRIGLLVLRVLILLLLFVRLLYGCS